MWLGHFIEHLMCIGGELEHHKALPSPAREKQSTGVLYSRARGIYRHLIGPGSWHEPVLNPGLLSRFMPRTGTNGCGPGARTISPGSWLEPGQMVPYEPGPMPTRPRPAPWAHEPGQMPPLVPVCGRTGTNGLARPERKPLFLLVIIANYEVITMFFNR